MKSATLAFVLLALPLTVLAGQAKDKKLETDATPKDSIPITVASKGQEVRTVLMSIFDQEKKQYVIEPNIHFAVFLSLEKADFHRALDIVCTLSGLQADLKDGIYFVHPGRNAVVKPILSPAVSTPDLIPSRAPVVQIPTATIVSKPVAPLGPVPAAALLKHVTTRLTKATIRTLFSDLSRQTGVKIVVDDKVPAYKLDAFLINTSLRYALNKITRAAGLTWKLPPNRTILITPDATASTVAMVH
jgi:type II secretory pathway component GspD/PulD (secretin)